jgi:hypothetical protein
MPLYVWRDDEGNEVQVVRSVSEIELPPTREELDRAGLEFTSTPKRIVCAPKMKYGSGWKTRKGHH